MSVQKSRCFSALPEHVPVQEVVFFSVASFSCWAGTTTFHEKCFFAMFMFSRIFSTITCLFNYKKESIVSEWWKYKTNEMTRPILLFHCSFKCNVFNIVCNFPVSSQINTLLSVILFIDFNHRILNVISKTKSTQESFQSLVHFNYCDQSIN